MFKWLSTNYNKAFIFGATIILTAGPQILAQSASFGITPTEANWITLVVGVVGAITGISTGNKNQPTLPPNHVVVAASDVKPGANIVAAYKS